MEIVNGILKRVDNKDFKNGVLIIPEGVKEISTDFSLRSKNMYDLEKVVMPSSLKVIEKRAFYDCKALREVEFSSNIDVIGEEAFEGCIGLKSIKLPENLKAISYHAFAGCNGLEEVKFPKGEYEIDDAAFSNCRNLDGIVELGNVQKIGDCAFENCVNLKGINISSEKMEKIGRKAFFRCRSLQKAKLSKKIDALEAQAFQGCMSLEEVNIPEGISEIADTTFMHCLALKEVFLPDGIKSIGNNAFYKCKNLKNIRLPKDLKIIKALAFYECGKLGKVQLPEGLIEIGNMAFSNCWNLKNVDFPFSLKEIGAASFEKCFALKKVNLYETAVANSAFEECLRLTDFSIAGGSIETNALAKCQRLKNFRFGKDVRIEELPASVRKIKGIYKDGNNFVLSSNLKDIDAVSFKELGYSYVGAIAQVWDERKKYLKEIKNENVLKLYNLIYREQGNQNFEKFFQEKNLKFFKQIPYFLADDLDFDAFCRFYYNLGGFKQRVSETRLSKSGQKIVEQVDYAQMVGEFLKEEVSKENNIFLQSFDLFDGMKFGEFKPEFTRFFVKKENYALMLQELKRDKQFFKKCYEEYEEVQKTNTSHKGDQRQLKPTVEKFRNYFIEDKFNGITPDNYDIASTISPYYSSQQTFDNALAIKEEKLENGTPDHILGQPLDEEKVFGEIDSLSQMIKAKGVSTVKLLNELAQDNFTFEWLAKNDPKNYVLGKLCHCCAHLESNGYTFMHASIVHPDIQNLVLKNKEGEIVAKSTLYLNRKQGYGIFNNIEINRYVKAEDCPKVFRKFQLATVAFVKKYNELNPDAPIKKLNVGMDRNDAGETIRKELDVEKVLLPSFNYEEYGFETYRCGAGSKTEQYIVWEEDDKH